MNSLDLAQVDPSFRGDAAEVLDAYAKRLGGIRLDYFVKRRPDGPYLIVELVKPNEIHFRIHNEVVSILPDSNRFKERSTVQRSRSAPKDRLRIPETQLLKKEIAASLTVDRYTFSGGFFDRYTPSVTNFEQQITANANFIVYGRRGSGKSSLLSYGLHMAVQDLAPVSWVAMQPFANRAEVNVVPAVIGAVLHELEGAGDVAPALEALKAEFDALAEGEPEDVLKKCDRLVPRLRRTLGDVASPNSPLTIFLDDVHVIPEEIQPLVLSYIYKLTRGNNAYIKASGIAQLTRLWDSATQAGLQAPHDAQVLNLDLNLTIPDKSKEHIVSILDSHARYCGLPDIGYLARDNVLSRLVLVAAGVPRDALNLLSLAVSKASAKGQRSVSITSVNAAASEMAEEKLKDVELDSGRDLADVEALLADVKRFCITQERKNAFLMEIKNNSRRYQLMQKLAALRLVHVLHEGITPHKAGRRFVALVLDYGVYVGIRAAKSVELIPSEPRVLLAKELRSLPIFR